MQRGLVQERIQEMMRDSGALLEGHFLLSSGLHSSNYLQCALLLRFPAYAAFAAQEIARLAEKLQPTIVVAPALGGLIIGHEVARALNIPFIFCEREEGKMKLRRFPFPEKAGALVVEDVITTGGSVQEVGNFLVNGGARWLATACIVNRSGGKHILPHEPLSLWNVSFPVYRPEECPYCAKGIPWQKPGSRK
ncbi:MULTISPECIES: orotate phosphoribosyltransferase [Aminobacterium]|jgi:orotate phosphoribosyltransferase|uniref:orotate phosphoribosyltransferase n=1 Tax=Aminobacterium TaxID=81466 RepID=UPI00257B3634|nr:orotate phosphoribosyltransferase [Aminobacterium sp. UBA4834]